MFFVRNPPQSATNKKKKERGEEFLVTWSCEGDDGFLGEGKRAKFGFFFAVCAIEEGRPGEVETDSLERERGREGKREEEEKRKGRGEEREKREGVRRGERGRGRRKGEEEKRKGRRKSKSHSTVT